MVYIGLPLAAPRNAPPEWVRCSVGHLAMAALCVPHEFPPAILRELSAGLAFFIAKPAALSRRRHTPSAIGVPERVHFTEF
jgi:hypothetical protein